MVKSLHVPILGGPTVTAPLVSSRRGCQHTGGAGEPAIYRILSEFSKQCGKWSQLAAAGGWQRTQQCRGQKQRKRGTFGESSREQSREYREYREDFGCGAVA